ncbi:GntR family transcriptional regulator [Photobacterium rosenbergii]|uniref:GntR family transcriptional regulator n=1 Tax=Photobacterium rosenbergii TaxID=294936 RepID=A0A2T3N6F8_9GAMM|nr:GntR family transcriptional regulator [Photobacterium rosenbergii]PSW08281.1 GntR family transcriptional regulator [Photobacterium rosenbergii]
MNTIAALSAEDFSFELEAEEQSAIEGTSRSEFAYHMLRMALQRGVFKPGQRLREVELSTALNVSRTPIREALHRLANDGLLTISANKGVAVAQLDIQQVMELYTMREILEGAAAGLAATRASDMEVMLMQQLLDEDRQSAADDYARHALMNRRFHRTIYQAAHNPYLLRSLDGLRDAMALLGKTTLSDPTRWQTALEEHQAMVDAIKNRDASEAEKLARSHVQNALKERMKQFMQ